MEESLGQYIVFLRKQKLNISVSRHMAEKLEITAQYMHDIENDNRVPSEKLLKKMEEIFELSQKEKEKMYDLAAISHKNDKVPADIARYIIGSPKVRTKIREMMKKDEEMEDNKNGND